MLLSLQLDARREEKMIMLEAPAVLERSGGNAKMPARATMEFEGNDRTWELHETIDIDGT